MARKSKDHSADVSADTTIIKKYANRRLYNTASSSYITLEDLASMVRENVEFVVFDAKSGEDITHSILTQIIMDEESNGKQMLPVSFLRQLIGMYGNSMQNLMPSYLEASMTNFRQNQGKIREAFEKGMSNNPLTALHETNMAMMRAAAETLIPGASNLTGGKNTEVKPEASAKSDPSDELAAMRDQMAAMQKKLDELGK